MARFNEAVRSLHSLMLAILDLWGAELIAVYADELQQIVDKLKALEAAAG